MDEQLEMLLDDYRDEVIADYDQGYKDSNHQRTAKAALHAHVAALTAERDNCKRAVSLMQEQLKTIIHGCNDHITLHETIKKLESDLARAREALKAMADRICNTFCRPINRHRFSQKPEDMKHCKLCSEMEETLKSALTPGGNDDGPSA